MKRAKSLLLASVLVAGLLAWLSFGASGAQAQSSAPDELPLPVVSGLVPAVIRRHWAERNSEDFAAAPGARFEIDAP